MIKEIFENYEAFYNMVLSTTIMSNAQTEELDKDATEIIQFIGNAYRLSEEFTSTCTNVILEKLSTLGKITDQQAIYSRRRLDDKFSDNDTLFDIKGDVLYTLTSIGIAAKDNCYVNVGWFDYTHYKTYQADVRFHKLLLTSSSGNLVATRQVGILLALGIGCNTDYAAAQTRLKQCAFWGDIPSMYYLGYLYGIMGNEQQCKLFYELAELSTQYLHTGCTVLPEQTKSQYSAQALTYYVYISTILQDVVYAYKLNNIDFSFLEAMMSPNLDYYQRMKYINYYSDKSWKNVTNPSQAPTRKLGFN